MVRRINGNDLSEVASGYALGYNDREFSAQDAIDTLGIIDVGQLQ